MPADQPSTGRRVEPLDVDAVRTVQIGTAMWALGLIATVIARDPLEEQGRLWWIWTCVVGVVLGLLGLFVTTRRRRRIDAARPSGQRS